MDKIDQRQFLPGQFNFSRTLLVALSRISDYFRGGCGVLLAIKDYGAGAAPATLLYPLELAKKAKGRGHIVVWG